MLFLWQIVDKMREIEVKFKIKDFDALKRKIEKIGARYKDKFSQSDTWFVFPGKKRAKKWRGFRLRSQKGKAILTLKKDQVVDRLIREAEEIEVEVSDFERMMRILVGLGFQKEINIKKERETWQIGEVEIALDKVEKLGNFLELEGPKKEIEAVVKKLGLERAKRITLHYGQLFVQKAKGSIS
jgi:adenylate cyclase class 2